MVAEMICAA